MATERQTSSSGDTSETTTLLLAEYSALREEILKRMEQRYQVQSLAVILLGTILGFGLQAHSSSVILLYPILVTFLAAIWSYNGLSIRAIGSYIREHIESKVGEANIGWEHINGPHIWPSGLNFLSARGIFIGTSLLAILVAVPLARFDPVEILLFVLAPISVICSVIILTKGTSGVWHSAT